MNLLVLSIIKEICIVKTEPYVILNIVSEPILTLKLHLFKIDIENYLKLYSFKIHIKILRKDGLILVS